MCVRMFILVCICQRVCVCVRMSMHLHMHVSVHVYVCAHECAEDCAPTMCVCVYACTTLRVCRAGVHKAGATHIHSNHISNFQDSHMPKLKKIKLPLTHQGMV